MQEEGHTSDAYSRRGAEDSEEGGRVVVLRWRMRERERAEEERASMSWTRPGPGPAGGVPVLFWCRWQ
eukprot:3432738-Rhodomonas_salina.2